MTTITGGQRSSSVSRCGSILAPLPLSITASSVFDVPCPGLFPELSPPAIISLPETAELGPREDGGGVADSKMDEWEAVAAVITVSSEKYPEYLIGPQCLGGNGLVGVNVGILLLSKDERPLWPYTPGGRGERRCAAAPRTCGRALQQPSRQLLLHLRRSRQNLLIRRSDDWITLESSAKILFLCLK